MLNRQLSHYQRVFIALLSFDFAILLLHLSLGQRFSWFHLDFESNLPTYYQSLKLIVFGAAFIPLSFMLKIRLELKFFLVPLGLFLSLLGLDELLQIHENIYRLFELFDWLHPSKIVEASMKMGYRSSLWILYYLPIIVLVVFWSGYWLAYFQSKVKGNFWIIGVSSLALFTILLMEILSSTGSFAPGVYTLLVTVEEVAEMVLGSTLVLVGLKVLAQ